MEITNDDIVLLNNGSRLLAPFSLKYGEAIIVFAPYPKGHNVRFVEGNADSFCCSEIPAWVECTAYSVKKKDIRLINENIDVFRQHDVFPLQVKKVSQRVIDQLEGGDTRLMNLLLCRLKGITFIELNIIGLTFASIYRMFRFVVSDVSNHRVAYIVVNYMDENLKSRDPLPIDEKTIPYIMHELVKDNRINQRKFFEKMATLPKLPEREPTEQELKIICYLADKGHYARHDWRKNLKVADESMESLQIIPEGQSNPKRLFGKEISEVQFRDTDGMLVYATLTTDQEGFLFELDVWRCDFENVINFDNIMKVIGNNETNIH